MPLDFFGPKRVANITAKTKGKADNGKGQKKEKVDEGET